MPRRLSVTSYQARPHRIIFKYMCNYTYDVDARNSRTFEVYDPQIFLVIIIIIFFFVALLK